MSEPKHSNMEINLRNYSMSEANEEISETNFEEKLFKNIEEYFKINEFLTENDLPNFIKFLGFGDNWNSKEELQCLWKELKNCR